MPISPKTDMLNPQLSPEPQICVESLVPRQLSTATVVPQGLGASEPSALLGTYRRFCGFDVCVVLGSSS